MKLTTYSIVGLFILGLVLAAGNSFSQSRSSFGSPSESAFAEYGSGPQTPPGPFDFILRPAPASFGQYSSEPPTPTAGTKR